MRVIILLGRSGAGKGTQAQLLRDKFGLEYIGSGDLLRARAKVADFSGTTIRTVLAQGGFSPTALIFKLWMDKMEDFKSRVDFPGFLFDGSPRKIMEAYLIDETMQWYGWKEAMKIFLLDLSSEAAFERLMKRRICDICKVVTSVDFLPNDKKNFCAACGGEVGVRLDDEPDSIKSRLALFEKEVLPIIEYYKKDNRLIAVDGSESIQGVFENICNHIISKEA